VVGKKNPGDYAPGNSEREFRGRKLVKASWSRNLGGGELRTLPKGGGGKKKEAKDQYSKEKKVSKNGRKERWTQGVQGEGMKMIREKIKNTA